MRKTRYTEDQIEAAVRQAESGAPIADIARKLGVSEATFFVWKKRFNRVMPDTSELTRLRFENAELKRLVIDLICDRELCKATHAKDGAASTGPAVKSAEPARFMAST
jgi:putative transposase